MPLVSRCFAYKSTRSFQKDAHFSRLKLLMKLSWILRERERKWAKWMKFIAFFRLVHFFFFISGHEWSSILIIFDDGTSAKLINSSSKWDLWNRLNGKKKKCRRKNAMTAFTEVEEEKSPSQKVIQLTLYDGIEAFSSILFCMNPNQKSNQMWPYTHAHMYICIQKAKTTTTASFSHAVTLKYALSLFLFRVSFLKAAKPWQKLNEMRYEESRFNNTWHSSNADIRMESVYAKSWSIYLSIAFVLLLLLLSLSLYTVAIIIIDTLTVVASSPILFCCCCGCCCCRFHFCGRAILVARMVNDQNKILDI